MTPSEWQKAKDRVRSWMENELHCVTAQRISQSLEISRRDGSHILLELLEENPKWRIVTCQKTTEDENITVFRLHKSTTVPSKDDDTTTVVALASLESTEAISTAHERDMIQLREMVEDGRYKSGHEGAIVAADEIRQLQNEQPHLKKQVIAECRSSGSQVSSSAMLLNAKAKAVTAASFFASAHKNRAKASASAPEENAEESSSTLKKNDSKSKIENASKKSSFSSSFVPRPTREKENKVQKNQLASKTTKKVGNADDFVADEEDSDDDDDDEKNNTKKRTKTRPAILEDEPSPVPNESEKVVASPVRGAMDAFATSKASARNNIPQNSHRQRKRRKKLVERTTMVNGYLKLENQVVWEDIPSDEENREEEERIEKSKVSNTSSNKPKNAQAMKQKSLMGFFTKKK